MTYKTLYRKLKNEQHEPHYKSGIRMLRKGISSCSPSDTHCFTPGTNTVISHALGKDRIMKKWKNKYHTIGKMSKSNIKIVERSTIYTPNTHIHARSLFLFGTGTSNETSMTNEIYPRHGGYRKTFEVMTST
jgi:hypothetical protein